jgi:hypothetical protein
MPYYAKRTTPRTTLDIAYANRFFRTTPTSADALTLSCSDSTMWGAVEAPVRPKAHEFHADALAAVLMVPPMFHGGVCSVARRS